MKKAYICYRILSNTGYPIGPIYSIFGTLPEAVTFAKLKLYGMIRGTHAVVYNGDTNEILCNLEVEL